MRISYFLFFFAIACKPNGKDPIPDLSNHKIEIEWIEIDKLIFTADSQTLPVILFDLSAKYPQFMKLYSEDILQLTDSFDLSNIQTVKAFQQFIADSAIQNLSAIIQQQYSHKEKIKNQCNRAASLMKYYFPTQDIPRVYSLLSEFGVGCFIFKEENKDALGIGLDFFLGDKIDYKNLDPKNPAFSDYINRTFNEDHLLKKTWEIWVDDFIPESTHSRFLDEMIREGKKLYLLSKLLPEISDTVLFEYSSDQLNWCIRNKVEMWSFFLDNQLLYSTEHMKYNKYIKPNPTSPGMPAEAPGRTGAFIGYHIIRAFVDRKNMQDPKQVLDIQDARQILEESRFKPKNQ